MILSQTRYQVSVQRLATPEQARGLPRCDEFAQSLKAVLLRSQSGAKPALHYETRVAVIFSEPPDYEIAGMQYTNPGRRT